MKMRTNLLILFVGLASLWSGMGPAKADWTIGIKPSAGYPIKNAEGGSGDAGVLTSFTPYGTPVPSVTSYENSTASGLNA